MKLIKIEPDEASSVITMEASNRTLCTCTLTFKKFWTGKEVQMKALPTNWGPTYGTGRIQYFIFVNEIGEEYDDDISRQINNFLFHYFLNKV